MVFPEGIIQRSLHISTGFALTDDGGTLTKALDAAYDGIGSGAVPKKKHAEPKKPATDRDALFTKRDKDGVLSREEFVKQGKLK